MNESAVLKNTKSYSVTKANIIVASNISISVDNNIIWTIFCICYSRAVAQITIRKAKSMPTYLLSNSKHSHCLWENHFRFNLSLQRCYLSAYIAEKYIIAKEMHTNNAALAFEFINKARYYLQNTLKPTL